MVRPWEASPDPGAIKRAPGLILGSAAPGTRREPAAATTPRAPRARRYPRVPRDLHTPNDKNVLTCAKLWLNPA